MSNAFTDYDAITATVQHYIEGGRTGSSATMKRAFHENASIHGYLGPDLISGPIQVLYDWVDANPAASGLVDRIASIDIRESFATVRIELDDWASHRFTDLMTLLKTDGEWKIVCKVFHLHG